MSLEIGIVGLPNVGKSTLFNALLKKQQALAANYPFATIEPNVGVVPVPDPRLEKLAAVVKSEKIVPATVKFVDIAGLVKGASQGEGLGNKFLAHIREVDAICYVLRDFGDENIVRAGSVNPQEDLEVLKMELELADMQMQEKRQSKGKNIEEQLPLLAHKPAIVVINTDEDKLAGEVHLLDDGLFLDLEDDADADGKVHGFDFGVVVVSGSEDGLDVFAERAFGIEILRPGLHELPDRAFLIVFGALNLDFFDDFEFLRFGGSESRQENGDSCGPKKR
jgi:hypothetical protein